VRRDRRHERCRVGRLRGEDHLARADRLLARDVDEQRLAVGLDRLHTTPGPRPRAELLPHRRRQAAGPAEQVARDQRALAAPDQREQPDAAAGRQLVQLGGRAVRGAGEDRFDGPRQRSEQIRERAVVLVGVVVDDAAVARDRALDLHARASEGQPVARRKREPERVGLHTAAGQLLGPHCQAHLPAGDRHRLQAAVARQRADERAGTREQVRAIVQPVLAAGIGPHPAAEPVGGLEQQEVAMTQSPRGAQPRDASPDDHHVSRRHGAMFEGSRSPR